MSTWIYLRFSDVIKSCESRRIPMLYNAAPLCLIWSLLTTAGNPLESFPWRHHDVTGSSSLYTHSTPFLYGRESEGRWEGFVACSVVRIGLDIGFIYKKPKYPGESQCFTTLHRCAWLLRRWVIPAEEIPFLKVCVMIRSAKSPFWFGDPNRCLLKQNTT